MLVFLEHAPSLSLLELKRSETSEERILLGDKTDGGAVLLRPITFQRVRSSLPSVYVQS
jgi:hypothetical protein